ncbi:MAG: DUF47 domain-containing protein [Flavobacterium sp.]|nr:DUF47 domain-containing protein [Flavobacterium sp.]
MNGFVNLLLNFVSSLKLFGDLMFRNLLPKEYVFFDFFESHSNLSIKLMEELIKVLSDPSDLTAGAKEIKKLESELDQIEVACVEALHKTFITPFERTEIYKLIGRMDDIVNCMNAALSRMDLYEIDIIRPEALKMAEIVHNCCIEIGLAVKLLRDMKNIEAIRDHCQKIRKFESEGDKLFKSAIKNLFHEKDAVLIIKWKEIFDRIEKGIDRCQDVANIIEEVTIENA